MTDDTGSLDDSSIDMGGDSVLTDGPDSFRHLFSVADLPGDQLRQAIHGVPVNDGEDMTRIEIVGGQGQHNALMRLDHHVKLRVRGSLGDYAFAYNARTIAKIYGNVGQGVGDGLISGAVRVRGHAGHAVGTSMTGGTIAVYGNAGDRVGSAMRGGGIFIRGNVGNDAGLNAILGSIVIGGDAGENLGDPASDVGVFIRGKAASLAAGVTEAPLRKKQEVQLGILLISAGIRGDAADFRRIVPVAKLEAEKAARGEVVPNWR